MIDTHLQEAYNELAFYTLALQDKEFIHQHIVDAQTVQTADKDAKPISVIFSLVGLYLYIEQNFTGKEVQRFHMKMSGNKITWPVISLPLARGNITVKHVVNTELGIARNQMIHHWCASVWKACEPVRESVTAIVNAYLANPS